MAIYKCNKCEQLVDDDWYPGEVDPDDDCELICPICYEGLEESASECRGCGDDIQHKAMIKGLFKNCAKDTYCDDPDD